MNSQHVKFKNNKSQKQIPDNSLNKKEIEYELWLEENFWEQERNTYKNINSTNRT